MNLMTSEFALRYPGRGPFYEIWFGKMNIRPDMAFWFRYTLLDGIDKKASTWAILFKDGSILASKEGRNLSELSFADSEIRIGTARLNPTHAVGKAGSFFWDMTFKDRGRSFELIPKIFYSVGLSKSLSFSCLLDLRFNGVLRHGDQDIILNDTPGMIEHSFGKKLGAEWAWLHCNVFDGNEDVAVEGLSTRIRAGGMQTPPMASFTLFVKDQKYTFSSLWKLIAEESDYRLGKWVFKVRNGSVCLEGEVMVTDPRRVAVIRYTDTDGSPLWCHNSKLADLKLRLIDSKKGIDQTFTATGSAAFEIVNRDPPSRDVTL